MRNILTFLTSYSPRQLRVAVSQVNFNHDLLRKSLEMRLEMGSISVWSPVSCDIDPFGTKKIQVPEKARAGRNAFPLLLFLVLVQIASSQGAAYHSSHHK